MNTILLTGATGFLGSHLLESFLNENYNVVVLKRTFSDTWRIDRLLEKVRQYNIDAVPLDVCFRDNKIDTVVHAATLYDRNERPKSEIIESNILLPLRLLELGIDHGINRFFNTDTFFNTGTIEYDYLPGYTITKMHLIDWLKLYSKRIAIINLKLGHIYGPKDGGDKFVMWLVHEMLKEPDFIKLTHGEQKRDFVYISDAVGAYTVALQRCEYIDGYHTYDVCSGKKYTIKDFVISLKRIISSMWGRELSSELHFGELNYRKGEIMDVELDAGDIRALGWSPNVTLDEGLSRTVRWCINEYNLKIRPNGFR